VRPLPRPTPAPGAALGAALGVAALVAVLLAGCDALTHRPTLPRDFGAPYDVRVGVVIEASGAPVQPTPAVTLGGELWAVVTYRGGCGAHAFQTEADGVASGGSVVWFRHQAWGETCNRLVQDTLRIALDAPLRPSGTAPAVTLATPGGDELPLTWSATAD
jgi:hypothetical protein